MVEKILVPVDCTPRARAALEQALALALPLGATVDVLFVWTPSHYVAAEVIAAAGAAGFSDYSAFQARRQLRDFLSTLDLGEVEVRARLEQGEEAANTIVEIARSEHYDLLVLGTSSRSAWWGMLLGSVSQRVARRVSCPVLTVRPPASANDTQLS
jgi:nucleotide-binding universal stress UspA family protein